MNSFTCAHTRALFSPYLDGAVSGLEMGLVAHHVETCSECRREWDALREAQAALAGLGAAKAPADLGVRLRVAISNENARRHGRGWDSLVMCWKNIVRPMLVQVSAGLAGTVVLVGGLGMLLGMVAAPQAVMANDEPLGALSSPHFLYSAAPQEPLVPHADILIEAQINERGQVYDYRLLTGPLDPETEAKVREDLMLRVYEPARVFDQPVRSRALVTFAAISVRG